MEYYNIFIGTDHVRIEIEQDCIDFENWTGELAFDSIEMDVAPLLSASFVCSVRRCANVAETVKESLPFFRTQNTAFLFCGMYRNVYYTVNEQYGLFARTDLDKNTILIDVKARLISNQSMYFIRSIIREHALRLLFAMGRIPIHAAAVLDDAGQCILIAGESGTGKSSATWHFMQQGYRLMSDDVSIYLPSSGQIAGCGGALYVRPDFVERYSVSEYSEVSKGRKYRIPIERGVMALSKPSGIVLMQPHLGGEAASRELKQREALEQFLLIHKNWCKMPVEKHQLIQYSEMLIASVPYVGALTLGTHMETAVANIAKRIRGVTLKSDAYAPIRRE